MPIKNTLLTMSLALALTVPAEAREEAPIIYSNMTIAEMSALFKNAASVGHLDYLPSNHSQKGSVAFAWYNNMGDKFQCYYNVTTQHGYPLDSLHIIRGRKLVNKRCFYANLSTAIN